MTPPDFDPRPTPLSLVLASASPRRRRLLGELGLEFAVRPPETDESPLPGECPAPMVERLARDKALAKLAAGEVVLGADTTVAIGDEILGKPLDEADARRMLARIAGREHVVFTGVALAMLAAGDGGAPRCVSRVTRTLVRMRALDQREIADYVATGEPLDKAGSYAIQELGSLLVEGITGDFTNVVGLPLPTVAACFDDLGLRLLDFRRK